MIFIDMLLRGLKLLTSAGTAKIRGGSVPPYMTWVGGGGGGLLVTSKLHYSTRFFKIPMLHDPISNKMTQLVTHVALVF